MDLESRLQQGPLRVRDVWSPDKTERLSRRVVRLRRRRSLVRAAGLLGTALCTASVAVALRGAWSPRPQLESAAGALPARSAVHADGALVLRDGSRAEPIDEGGRVSLLRDDPEHVSVRLARGAARFSVVPNPERRFEVESGPVLVRVLGTTFTVTRTEDSARVQVERGRVHVQWAGGTALLAAGESGVFPPPAAAPDADVQPNARAGAANAPAWRELARRGEYRRAYSALHRTAVRDAPEDHMLAADVARLSGHPQQAVAHLRTVAQRFAADARAPVAAFTLGRVLMHDLQRPREAAAAFHRARVLWRAGPLALDAWAGEAEALKAAGEHAAAAGVAAGYLSAHPEGRHAAALRALAADLRRAGAGDAAAASE